MGRLTGNIVIRNTFTVGQLVIKIHLVLLQILDAVQKPFFLLPLGLGVRLYRHNLLVQQA